MGILVTGGLGYIGSHVSFMLKRKAIIIDNSSNSQLNYKKFLPNAIVYNKDINYKNLKKIFLNHKISGVVHLAGYKSVNQSVKNPITYYKNNLNCTLDLLEAIDIFRINKLIFSSSATVYGNNNNSPFNENMDLRSINPYASTKIQIEQLINDYALSNKSFRSFSLRYFNPIGADLNSGLSDRPLGAPQNIMPLLMNSIKNKNIFYIYGNDYKTRDGTCLRDYIHVKDLAEVHLIALKKLSKIKGHIPINIGLGKGISVLKIVKVFEKINKVRVNYKFTKRRKGDVPISYADNHVAKKILSWKPRHSLEDMVRDSWAAFRYNND